MSTGAKWGIGIAVAFVLLIGMSCAGLTYLGLSGPDAGMSLGDSIAVIHIDGVIAGTGTRAGGYITPEYMLDQLDQALADDGVKSILLRIDSPGGTVAASQEISTAVRRASAQKPVVVSVGDICASGAYMVASQCDSIVASPGSAVGSIGVIMEIPNVEGLLDKVGVDFTVITKGDLKDTGSYFRSVTPSETALFDAQMTLAYDQFITDVAEGRGMLEPDVREMATGWVWLGAEAIDMGLVDKLGNYDDAIDEAARLGGIEGEPGIVSYEQYDPFDELFYDLIGLDAARAGVDADMLRRLGLPK
jgi:protease-4